MAKRPAADLPQWDLGDLYASPDSPELARDLDDAEAGARSFAERYRGRLADLDGQAFGGAIAAYEQLTELLNRASSYAQLRFAAQTDDPETARFFQTIRERVNKISAHLLFFTLEIGRLDDAAVAAKLRAAAAKRYAPWVRDMRAFREHLLVEEIERLFHEKSPVGDEAWVRLFDETLSDLRFSVDGATLSLSETLNRLSDADRAVRRAAAKGLGEGLTAKRRLFALILNTLVRSKAIEDEWRRYPRPVSARNLANHVEDEVVDALVAAVRRAYPDTAHRYYRLKARWLGTDAVDYWDRLAPLPAVEERRFSWGEARDLVLGAYRRFDPDMAGIAGRFFERRWIDAAPRPGKDSGAFSHSTVPSVHPYILMNFHGRPRDVATLAHELGHGIHQVLAAPQGALMADTPLTLAETASVFGEMLTFQAVLQAETDPVRRRALLAAKVEDMLNTVVRQTAFFEFERRLHEARRSGELLAEQIADLWVAVQQESLGPAFRMDDGYRYFWAYVSRFVHAPFYVYAYAFGDCLVNALYDVFQGGHPGFQAKYLKMLQAGGTQRHRELLVPFGLDASDPDFWQRGLKVIGRFIDELEALS